MSQQGSVVSPDYDSQYVEDTPFSGLSQQDARRMYEKTQQRLSQTHEQLNSAIRVRTTSPMSSAALRQNDSEIASLKAVLAQIQGQMANYERMLNQANETIARQERTILTQSKTIENPCPGRDFGNTPRRPKQKARGAAYRQDARTEYAPYGQNSGYMPPLPSQPMYDPALEMNASPALVPYNTDGMFFNNPTGNSPLKNLQPGTARHGQSGYYGDFRTAPPSTPAPQYMPPNTPAPQYLHSHRPVNHQSAPYNGLHDPFGPPQPHKNPRGKFQKYQSWDAFDSPVSVATNPYPETSMPFGSVSGSTSISNDEISIHDHFRKLFDMVHTYTAHHANHPSTQGDANMPQDIKDRLLNAATVNTAAQIMADPTTRYLLVGKIVIAWIVKHILKFNAFAGLDANIDQVIAGAKATIYQSTPPQLKYLILANVANEVNKLRARADFAGFTHHLAEQRAGQLVAVVRPMMHLPAATDETADLVPILKEAYKLAETMFTHTDEYSFQFHTLNTFFDGREMVNIDPIFGYMLDDKLRKSHAAVRLGATPVVRIRENTVSGSSVEKVLVKGKVILKKVNA